MIVAHEKDAQEHKLESPEVKNVNMKVLVSPEQGWKDHVMRLIELGQGGYTPRHTHNWPHINYIVAGRGVLHMDGENTQVAAGSYAFVPPGCRHQFKNEGEETFRFICIVPKEGHQL